MSALLAILAPLFGVALGGAITYLTTKQSLDREDSRRRRESTLEKYQQIHEALVGLSEHHKSAFGEFLGRFGAGRGVDANNLKKNPIMELHFLVEAFLPESSEKLDQIDNFQTELGELMGKALSTRMVEAERGGLMQRSFGLEKRSNDLIASVRKDLHLAARRAHNS